MTEATKRVTVGLAAAAAALAVVVLASWAFDLWSWVALDESYVPMAPGTAMLVLTLAIALLFEARGPADGTSPPLSRSLAMGAGLVAALVLVFATLGREFIPEAWLFPEHLVRGGVRIGRVSQYTAALALLISASLAWPRHSAAARTIASVLALVALVSSALIVQAYLLRGPVLYGSDTIPVAALTAVCHLLLATGALIAVGLERWPLRTLFSTERSVRHGTWGFRALLIGLSLFVSVSGYFWYRGERDRAEDRAKGALLTVSEATADRLSAWYATRLEDAHAIRTLAPPSARTAAVAGPGTRTERALTAWLEAVRDSYGFELVGLFDASGRAIAVTPDSDRISIDSLGARVRALAPGVGQRIVIDDIVAAGQSRPLTMWLPLDAPGTSAATRRWLLLRIDARRALAPIVRGFPSESGSPEIVVYQRDGNTAMPLHDLRGIPNESLDLRIPLDSSLRVPGVLGLLGHEGVAHAVDYAGRPVTAAIRRVPATPWVVVAKMDRTELAAPVLRLAVRATALSLFLVITVAGAVYGLWRRRDLAAVSREVSLLREREATTDELRRSEDRYARATRGTSDGIWDWDIATGDFYISPRWRELMKVAEEQSATVQSAFFDRLHPEDRARTHAALSEHFEHGTPFELEIRARDDEGRYHWLWTRGEAQRDADGHAIRMAGAITDVSERHAAEDALRRLDRILRLRSAANQALVRASDEQELVRQVCDVAVREGGYRMAWVGYAQMDEERTLRPIAFSGDERGYLMANPVSWAEGGRGNGPGGRAIRSGMPQVFQDLPGSDDFAPWRAAALERGYAAVCAIPLLLDGSAIGALMLYSADPAAFNEDERTLLVEIGGDLSFGIKAMRDHERVAEQQAQLSLFRQVMDRSEDSVFVIDVATGLFIDFNETALRQHGYTADEMRKLGPRDIMPPPEEPQTHQRKDGTTFPVETSRTVVEADGRTVILAVVRDITAVLAADVERSELQEQLLRSQRMESVGRLAGGLAHDFNNLLTVINASADLASGDLPADSPVLDDLQQIRAAGERAAELTRQLLAFSRQQVMRREHLDLNAVVSKFLGMLRRVVGEHIRVEASLAAHVTPVFADPGQLDQVLMNVCVNARDAMPGGGTMTIATSRVVIDEEFAAHHETMMPGPHVRLAITDTGEGMPPEVAAHIFDPFFTTKESGKGTGLGLSTVYGIVKQTGGSIWVTSELGMGSTFEIYFPESESAPAEPESAPSVESERGQETILVVEDEPGIRDVVRRLLSQAGYTVIEAASGREALQRLAAHKGPLHLVLTDIVMPGMTGIALAKVLRIERPRLPVLLSSGYSAEAVHAEVHREPGWHLMSKPYSGRVLLKEVRRVLDERH